MSKTAITNPAFQSNTSRVNGFHLVTDVNPFTSVFGKGELEENIVLGLEQIVIENAIPGLFSEEQASSDLEEMKLLTAEIRAVGKQSLILIGERVFKARNILKKYKEGSFTQWLLQTFGCRRTGYNYLTYYEFYRQLPNVELQETFKKFPQKFAYKLASRKGDINVKCELVREYSDYPLEEMERLMKEMLPHKEGSTKSDSPVQTYIERMRQSLQKLLVHQKELSEDQIVQLSACQSVLNSLLSQDA